LIVTDERVARFISDRMGVSFCPPYVAIGIERGEDIIGAALFNHFEAADIHVSIAGEGWTRGFIRAVGVYVYDQLRCERMTAITGDPKVIEYAERLGGKVEGVMRNHFGNGKDATIVGILRDEWRY
jgi:RimJ/RimL family protein N-acetyltransferase